MMSQLGTKECNNHCKIAMISNNNPLLRTIVSLRPIPTQLSSDFLVVLITKYRFVSIGGYSHWAM